MDKKKKLLKEVLTKGLDKNTKEKRDKFMKEARKKYSGDIFKDNQYIYIDDDEN